MNCRQLNRSPLRDRNGELASYLLGGILFSFGDASPSPAVWPFDFVPDIELSREEASYARIRYCA